MIFPTRVQVLLILSVLVVGCSGKPTEGDPDTLHREADLREIYDMYTMYAKRNERPPTQASDLLRKNAEILYSSGVPALKSGNYVVVWGLSDRNSGTVLAYEKDALAKGGVVLMGDGTVKQMSADDLKAVLK